MLKKIRDWRARVLLIVVLFAIIGVTIYQLVLKFRADEAIQLANQALHLGDFEDAGCHLERYLSLRPNDPAMHILASQTARRRGDMGNAELHLRLASKCGADPDTMAFEYTLWRIQRGDLFQATAFAKNCAQNPSDPKAWAVLEAVIEGCLATSQDKPLADWSVEQWLKHSSGKIDQARGLLWRGTLRDSVGNRHDASADYVQAGALAPDFLPARLAVAREKVLENATLATLDLEWLDHHAPKNPKVRFLAAQWHYRLGRSEEAARLLDELLAADPARVAFLIERGRVAIDLQQLPDAEHWLQLALKSAPNRVEANAAMAECLRLMGRLDEAKSYQDKVKMILERKKNQNK